MASRITEHYSWVQLDEEPAANFPMTLYYMGIALASKSVGVSAGPIVLIYRGRSVQECTVKDGLARPGRAILEKLLRDKTFLPWMVRTTKVLAKRTLAYSLDLAKKDFSLWSNARLYTAYEKWSALALATLARSTYGTALEFEEPLLSGPLYEYLQQNASGRLRDKAGSIFSILTTPLGENENRTAEIQLITLVELARKALVKRRWSTGKAFLTYINEYKPEIFKRLTQHHNRYSYLAYGYSGPKKSLEETVDDFLRHLRSHPEVLRKRVVELQRADRQIRKKQQDWFRVLRMDGKHRKMFVMLRDIGGLKRWRKKLMVRSQFLVHGLLEEIARRLKVPLVAVQSVAPWEMRGALVQGKFSRSQLKKFSTQTVIWLEGSKWSVVPAGKSHQVVQNIQKALNIQGEYSELKGMCACTGKVVGHVKILRNAGDLDKFDAGDIIVSPATSPELVTAMRRAAAIVTDAGGITSHAAIVSRELGVPCVIGTKIATKVLKDGDRVEVDADNGVVKKIS